jgi:hypothetical protein
MENAAKCITHMLIKTVDLIWLSQVLTHWNQRLLFNGSLPSLLLAAVQCLSSRLNIACLLACSICSRLLL